MLTSNFRDLGAADRRKPRGRNSQALALLLGSKVHKCSLACTCIHIYIYMYTHAYACNMTYRIKGI